MSDKQLLGFYGKQAVTDANTHWDSLRTFDPAAFKARFGIHYETMSGPFHVRNTVPVTEKSVKNALIYLRR
jgi:hypothetical protein